MLKKWLKNINMAPFYKNRPLFCRFTAIFLLLGICLVGSCKTADQPGSYGSGANSEQFRIALFPDQVHADKDYVPAKGYINTAESYIAKNPDALLMLTSAEAKIIFGQPTVIRHDNPAEIWQYQARNCVVDIYFYQNSSNTPSRIAYYEIRRIDYDAHLDDGYNLSISKKAACLSRVISNYTDFDSSIQASQI